MKKIHLLATILVLVASSLACKALSGGDQPQVETLPPIDNSGGEQPAATQQSTDSGVTINGDSDFPMLEDASNVVDTSGIVTYQTGHSLDDVIQFYRDSLVAQGYTEREINTAITDATFNLVFDGHASGQALVIQGVDLGGSVNVTLFLQDM